MVGTTPPHPRNTRPLPTPLITTQTPRAASHIPQRTGNLTRAHLTAPSTPPRIRRSVSLADISRAARSGLEGEYCHPERCKMSSASGVGLPSQPPRSPYPYSLLSDFPKSTLIFEECRNSSSLSGTVPQVADRRRRQSRELAAIHAPRTSQPPVLLHCEGHSCVAPSGDTLQKQWGAA
ncbi:hypothetical protein GWK47_042825 [Chionoecetes opilio]|uniref:Uncharacterized protein n=1 Tax=Chionoecetes opilio TaxID=41210 RepID=A0A8J4YB05_CHIOP|nr:hypothetical protein GWK47_042825 [Chionoecetes opilio]